jgi:hypothetical protein
MVGLLAILAAQASNSGSVRLRNELLVSRIASLEVDDE